MFVTAGFYSLSAFLLILAAVITAIIAGVLFATGDSRAARRRLWKVFFIINLWLAALAGVVATGYVEAQPMPRALIFMVVMILAALLAASSRFGRDLALGLPLWFLVGFQAFRLPLELVLHQWSRDGVIPETMTWTGQNPDVITGLLALIVMPLASRSRWLAWAFNLVGVGLLLNVLRVAALSSPLPFAWDVAPRLQLLFHVPYFLIVPVCVAGAAAGHLVLTRALLSGSGRSIEEIAACEERLRHADLSTESDTSATLAELLADDVAMTGPKGESVSKAFIVDAHRPPKKEPFEAVTIQSREIRATSGAAVVRCLMEYKPAGAKPFTLRFVRVWQRQPNGWQITSGSVSPA